MTVRCGRTGGERREMKRAGSESSRRGEIGREKQNDIFCHSLSVEILLKTRTQNAKMYLTG